MPKGICLNLFGMYLARDTSWIDEKVINHERIHDAQQREKIQAYPLGHQWGSDNQRHWLAA